MAFPYIQHSLRDRDRSGFALLITITLLAFLVLLLVSLATLTRVETQVAANNQQLSQARQNALLALNIALGQLQRYAGPDQRVTARADLVAGVANPFYTGVWDATAPADPAAPLTWLVSGSETAPVTGTAQTDLSSSPEAVWLIHDHTVSSASDRVRVRRQAIAAADVPGLGGGGTVGHYAWWIGDEGVKARLDLVDAHAPAAASSAEYLYRLGVAQRSGIELVDDDTDSTNPFKLAVWYPANDSARLSRLLDVSQFPLAGADDPAVAGLAATAKLRHHDLTTRSRGLLVNTRDGGLREDLTYYLEKGGLTGVVDARLPATSNAYAQTVRWEKLRSYYDLAAQAAGGSLTARPDSETQQGVYPVFVQARLFFGLDYDADEKRSSLLVYPLLVVGNPCNVSLVVGDLRFRQESPNSKYIDVTVGGVTQRRVLTDVFGAYEFRAGAVTLAPGEAKVFSLADVLTHDAPAGGATHDVTVPLSEGLDTGTFIREQLPQEVAADSTPRQLVLGGGGSWQMEIRDGTTVLQTVKTVGWAGAAVTFPVSALGTPWFGFTQITKTAYGSEQGTNRDIVPYAHYNLRASLVDRPSAHAGIGYTSNPLVAGNLSSGAASNPKYGEALLNPRWGSSVDTNGKSRVVLLDVPRGAASADYAPLLSIGQFRHASLGTAAWEPLQAVGSSWASPYLPRDLAVYPRATPSPQVYYDTAYIMNEALWDRFFLSTVPQGTASVLRPGTDPLPNNRLRPVEPKEGSLDLDTLRGAGAPASVRPFVPARHLFVEGAFNVNSTSVDAWRALLASLRGLSLTPLSGATETGLTGPYARVARPWLGSTGAGDGGNDQAWAGFRNLTEAEISALAEKIVDEVRLRGPFRSLGEFVNRRLIDASGDTDELGLRGALQAAIEKAGLNAGFSADLAVADLASDADAFPDPAAANGNRATGIPGWVTQGDLLVPLGPVLSARSDTFVIRTYGDAYNPVAGETTGAVWCEAVVQRLPEPVETAAPGVVTDAEYATPPGSFGRKFVVVSFRWLSPGDI